MDIEDFARSLKHLIESATTNTKIAVVTAAGTTAGGGITALQWIPDDIGKLASLAGAGLSLVLIYTHLRRSSVENKKMELELEILRTKEEERRQRVATRHVQGLEVRRRDDFH